MRFPRKPSETFAFSSNPGCAYCIVKRYTAKASPYPNLRLNFTEYKFDKYVDFLLRILATAFDNYLTSLVTCHIILCESTLLVLSRASGGACITSLIKGCLKSLLPSASKVRVPFFALAFGVSAFHILRVLWKTCVEEEAHVFRFTLCM